MAIEGLDVEAVSNVGRQLMSQADHIDSVVAGVNSLINGIDSIWQGHDAKEFEGWWNTQHRPALTAARDAVHGLGQSALNNAAAQRDASSH